MYIVYTTAVNKEGMKYAKKKAVFPDVFTAYEYIRDRANNDIERQFLTQTFNAFVAGKSTIFGTSARFYAKREGD